MWYPVKTPRWISWLFPNLLWRLEATDPPSLYLSFDDGPIPEVTPWVLDQLAQYQAKATFFCLGRNVEQHPDIFAQIKAAGHQVANHSHTHLNGWESNLSPYLLDVQTCASWVDSPLFRPPYGRIKYRQMQQLQKAGYKIVMWDVIAGDFDQQISREKCWQNILKYTQNGSILVLHDSQKAWPHLQYVLPQLLAHYKAQGFNFKTIQP